MQEPTFFALARALTGAGKIRAHLEDVVFNGGPKGDKEYSCIHFNVYLNNCLQMDSSWVCSLGLVSKRAIFSLVSSLLSLKILLRRDSSVHNRGRYSCSAPAAPPGLQNPLEMRKSACFKWLFQWTAASIRCPLRNRRTLNHSDQVKITAVFISFSVMCLRGSK